MKTDYSILLVEDNSGDVRLIKELLKESPPLKFNIKHAGNLKDAIDIISTSELDSILLDLGLPDCVGLETFFKLNDHFPNLATTIILTGLNDSEIGLKAVNGGAQDYLIKGQVDSEKLTKSIVYSYERNRLNQELKLQLKARKNAEEELKKLQIAIENAEASVIITNLKGEIEYANTYFTRLTGFTRSEYLGQNPSILKSGYQTKEFYTQMWETITSGKTWIGEIYNKKKSGEYFWENMIISPITDDDNLITHFVAIKTDISKAKVIYAELIKAKEHAEESDRLKSAFLANMSHEIRTPMNGIIGFAELLKAPGLSGNEQQEYIKIIEKSGARMLNIINDIIDISKIESGLVTVNETVFNINEKLNYLITFFTPESESKGISLINKSGLPFAEAYIRSDEQKLYSILVNLIKNAVKYSNFGYIEIGYSLQKGFIKCNTAEESEKMKPADKQCLVFFVKDNGIGIPVERQYAIFERFVQADIDDTRAYQGAGLGLAIARSYVEMLGGKIWVESQVSVGSIFYFSIPYIPAQLFQPSESKAANITQHAVKSDRKLKVLIAEDDETSTMLVMILLNQMGSDILIASTGAEAIDICKENPDIDLILMDIKLPVLDGLEAVKIIREFNSKVVIVAQTAYGMVGDREKALHAGCNAYLAKPLNLSQLKSVIQKYVVV